MSARPSDDAARACADHGGRGAAVAASGAARRGGVRRRDAGGGARHWHDRPRVDARRAGGRGDPLARPHDGTGTPPRRAAPPRRCRGAGGRCRRHRLVGALLGTDGRRVCLPARQPPAARFARCRFRQSCCRPVRSTGGEEGLPAPRRDRASRRDHRGVDVAVAVAPRRCPRRCCCVAAPGVGGVIGGVGAAYCPCHWWRGDARGGTQRRASGRTCVARRFCGRSLLRRCLRSPPPPRSVLPQHRHSRMRFPMPAQLASLYSIIGAICSMAVLAVQALGLPMLIKRIGTARAAAIPPTIAMAVAASVVTVSGLVTGVAAQAGRLTLRPALQTPMEDILLGLLPVGRACGREGVVTRCGGADRRAWSVACSSPRSPPSVRGLGSSRVWPS